MLYITQHQERKITRTITIRLNVSFLHDNFDDLTLQRLCKYLIIWSGKLPKYVYSGLKRMTRWLIHQNIAKEDLECLQATLFLYMSREMLHHLQIML